MKCWILLRNLETKIRSTWLYVGHKVAKQKATHRPIETYSESESTLYTYMLVQYSHISEIFPYSCASPAFRAFSTTARSGTARATALLGNGIVLENCHTPFMPSVYFVCQFCIHLPKTFAASSSFIPPNIRVIFTCPPFRIKPCTLPTT